MYRFSRLIALEHNVDARFSEGGTSGNKNVICKRGRGPNRSLCCTRIVPKIDLYVYAVDAEGLKK